jgi:hypothetical protein
MAPGPHCPTAASVYVPVGGAPREPCTWHRKLRLDVRNGLRASGRCPDRLGTEKVFEILPPLYAAWQAEHATLHPPTEYSPSCPARGLVANAVVVTHPRDKDVFIVEPGYRRGTQSVQLTAEVDPSVPELVWLVDGERVAAVGWPYEATWPLTRGAGMADHRGRRLQRPHRAGRAHCASSARSTTDAGDLNPPQRERRRGSIPGGPTPGTRGSATHGGTVCSPKKGRQARSQRGSPARADARPWRPRTGRTARP